MTSADLSSRSVRSALGAYLALWAIAVLYLWAKGADWTFSFGIVRAIALVSVWGAMKLSDTGHHAARFCHSARAAERRVL